MIRFWVACVEVGQWPNKTKTTAYKHIGSSCGSVWHGHQQECASSAQGEMYEHVIRSYVCI